MIRKIIIYAIIFLLIPYCSFAVSVSDLYPTYKVYDSVNKIWTVPAKIVAKSSTAIATDSVALGLTKAIAGGIVTSLVIGAAGYYSNMYIDWLMQQSPPMYYDSDGVLKKNVNSVSTTPTTDWLSAAHEFCRNTCNPACECGGINVGSYNEVNLDDYIQFSYGSATVGGCVTSVFKYHKRDVNPWVIAIGFGSCCSNYQNVSTPTPVTYNELNDVVNNAIDQATSESAPIVDIVNKSIDKAADLVNNGAGISAANPSVAHDIEQKLNDAIPQSAANAVNDASNATDAADTAADNAVSEGDEAKGIISAVYDTLKKFFGVDVTPPVEPNIETPTKKNITSILNSFYNSISSLPIMSTLNGIAVTASGSPNLCVDLPAAYGGTKCWNASGNQADFNMIGSALLAVVSILSVMSIFKG